MLCLPQAFELFLKNLVGGLHTVYTKCKRYFPIRPGSAFEAPFWGFPFCDFPLVDFFFGRAYLECASAKGQCLGAGRERLTGG